MNPFLNHFPVKILLPVSVFFKFQINDLFSTSKKLEMLVKDSLKATAI